MCRRAFGTPATRRRNARLRTAIASIPRVPHLGLVSPPARWCSDAAYRKSVAIACTLIESAKLSGIDQQAWLTVVLGRSTSHKITRIDELLP